MIRKVPNPSIFIKPHILRSSVFSTSLYLQSRTAATTQPQKRAGDISDAFASLSGGKAAPLDPRFATLKKRLIAGHEDAVVKSWNRLLAHLRSEVAVVSEKRSAIIPTISYSDIRKGANASFKKQYKERGVCVIRDVVPEQEALEYKESLRSYIAANKERTKAFPAHDPQVYELYWSEAQLKARSHPNLLETQRFLMGFWKAGRESAISTQHPVAYADRLRMRQPGDASFALGPHVDGGSCERWEEDGYGWGGDGNGVYGGVFRGDWEKCDLWDASARLGVVSDLYAGIGACGAFRMAQGWLSMSNVKGGEGHLLVNPILQGAMAYLLLRPFFQEKRPSTSLSTDQYLNSSNWVLEPETTPILQGASPGHGQELSDILHPHLSLPNTMVYMPPVRPGDYVAWHCDTIHAVDKTHAGSTDSSVLYIPTCPLTFDNAQYLVRQRDTFLNGKPSPDFGGGEGESNHIGRVTVNNLEGVGSLRNADGLRSMGLEMWDAEAEGLTTGQRRVMNLANKELGFYV
ncbi:hypothetical protein E6O75_ATG01183 [Venturia nashicola]|uniref:DUF1479-domain-containing protein n=1 Tax=Venturia nashicola TaxID=86259 RepID=A0A4Z1PD16_9PEZI|nr:hypothetical protein E6O75_ATG01183 [Venturia nashicola]